MSAHKIHKTKNYTVMSNFHLKDKKLSLKAKGLLSLMLSLPEEWDYSTHGLCALSSDGETSIRSTLKELEENRYLFRTPIRTSGKIQDWQYDIYEEPQLVLPHVENVHVVNQTQLNTKELNTKELKERKKEETYDDILLEVDERLKEPLLEFIKMRKLIKSPLTNNALRLAINKLNKMSSNINEQVEIINQSVMNSWKGLFPLKTYDTKKQGVSYNNPNQKEFDDLDKFYSN